MRVGVCQKARSSSERAEKVPPCAGSAKYSAHRPATGARGEGEREGEGDGGDEGDEEEEGVGEGCEAAFVGTFGDDDRIGAGETVTGEGCQVFVWMVDTHTHTHTKERF